MNEKELQSLQPIEQSGACIRAALSRIAGAKTSAESRTRDAQAELDEKMKGGTLTSTHRRKLEDIVNDQQQDAVMLDALAGQVEAPLANIEMVERDERLGSERVALRAEMAALDEKWAVEYPSLHEALQKLLEERRELIGRIDAHSDAASVVFKRVYLKEFLLPTMEVRLLKTPEQRVEDAIPWHQRQAWAAIAQDEARRKAAIARGPTVVSDKPPKPTLTVGGVPQDITGPSWR